MRVFSGIQPSGGLHLGNYLGAVRQWLSPTLQCASCALFSVVDLHALSSPARATPALRRHTLEMSAALLACGLTPSPRLHLFPQSAVREHTELAWLLSCQTPLGKLQRMTQYKQKRGAGAAQEAAANLGLLSYPVLQAADILLYRATHVPVGEDQHQHLELAREVAATANAAWAAAAAPGAGAPAAPLFPLPATLTLPLGARVMSLKDGRQKMSKSDPDDAARINMDDSNDAIRAKVRAARTDSQPGFAALDAAARPEKANMVAILAALTGREPAAVAEAYAGASAVAFKEDLVDALVGTVGPVRERLVRLRGDWGAVEAALAQGTEAAREMAAGTMKVVRERAGVF